MTECHKGYSVKSIIKAFFFQQILLNKFEASLILATDVRAELDDQLNAWKNNQKLLQIGVPFEDLDSRLVEMRIGWVMRVI
jgi:hypothetical protein